jgi:SH3-like domain-containing protein
MTQRPSRLSIRHLCLAAAMLPALAGLSGADASPAKQTPYWASLSHDEARMRVGPSLDYPSNWVYRRRDLPVKVVQVLGLWRKIEDPDGTQGWMHVRLLSDTPTAIVRAQTARIRETPRDGARTLFRAQKGVVGRLGDCSAGWCAFDVTGQRGFVKAGDIWGATGE